MAVGSASIARRERATSSIIATDVVIVAIAVAAGAQ
jgi:hypothetical protein